MNPIKLKNLLVHNDIRIHPQKPSGRVFQSSSGYTLEWYPPHLFRVRISLHQPGIAREGEPNPMFERWFAVSNCEAWEVADGETVTIPDAQFAELTAKGTVEIHKTLTEIRSLLAGKSSSRSSK